MLDCGLRRGEIPKIKKQHIHYNDCSILINGKGSKERIITFGNVVKSKFFYTIQKQRKSNSLPFTTNKNTPLTNNAIKILFQNSTELKD